VNHNAARARLNIVRQGSLTGSWSARYNNNLQWLQLKLNKVSKITAFATQGRQDYNQWVKSYKLQYSLDGGHFEDYNGGSVFNGNSDRNTVVGHRLSKPIIAKYIRIRPVTWYGHISMRMELFGCTEGNQLYAHYHFFLSNKNYLRVMTPKVISNTIFILCYYYVMLHNESLLLFLCLEALYIYIYTFLFPGFQVPPIPQCGESIHLGDWMIVASSEWSSSLAASKSKLDVPGAWAARSNDANQWLQITFDREMKVTRVSIQGRYDADQWVKSFTLEYSKDGISNIPYKENGVIKVHNA